MDRTRLTLLLGAVVVVVVAAVVVATAGGDDSPPAGSGADAVAAPTTSAASEPTEPGPITTEAPATTATVETTVVTEPAVGDHPICPAWDAYVLEREEITFGTPEEDRRASEHEAAFYAGAVELLDGEDRQIAAGILAHHEERIAFWTEWEWDYDAYLIALVGDPDLPTVPWITAGLADGWRQLLTDRCGLEFVIEETS